MWKWLFSTTSADIGFVGGIDRHEGERVEGYDVFLGGNLEGIAKSEYLEKQVLKFPGYWFSILCWKINRGF